MLLEFIGKRKLIYSTYPFSPRSAISCLRGNNARLFIGCECVLLLSLLYCYFLLLYYYLFIGVMWLLVVENL